jgi:hypothetical protein
MITKTNKLIHLGGNCKIFFSYIENYYGKNMLGNSCGQVQTLRCICLILKATLESCDFFFLIHKKTNSDFLK